jgi:hypothetical protein
VSLSDRDARRDSRRQLKIPMRQSILYAEEMWRRQRTWAAVLLIVGIGFSIYGRFFQPKSAGDSTFLIWLAYIPAGLVLGGLLLYYRRRHAIETTEQGLLVQTMFSSVFLEWDKIRSVRVQPLADHFQSNDRRRLVRPMNKGLMDKPALYIKVKADDEELAQIRKKLGRSIVDDDVLALPIRDPDAFSWQVSSYLPERTAVNTNRGGQRRGKRRR